MNSDSPLVSQCAAPLCPVECVRNYCHRHQHKHRSLSEVERQKILRSLGVTDDE